MRTALLILAFLLFAIAAVLYFIERAIAPGLQAAGLAAAAAVFAFKISEN